MTALLLNTPPEPVVLFAEEVEDLLLEARNWLDGAKIETEEQATAVSSLLSRLRRVKNDADEARKVEKKPHDDAAKAVQARWTPIIDKAELAAKTAKQALAPYLQAIEEANRAKAAAEQAEADRIATIARQKRAEADGNLEAIEDAERLTTLAMKVQADATRAGKQRANVKGGERANSLRSVWTPTLTDSCAALRYYREHQPEALKQWLVEQAEKDVRAGARSIPGFEISEARVAV
jgi:predicted phage tail protein